MAGEKGFLGGSMKFGVGDDSSGPDERGALLPLRVLVIADLVPRDPYNAGASAPPAALRVDAARFDELFQKLRPRIAIEVPSVLAEGRNARVDLAPTSLKSFRPDGLCAELPLLRSLLDGRLVLDRLREGTITPEQARGELERLWAGSPFAREVLGLIAAGPAAAGGSPAGPAPKPGGSSVDSILSLVDLGPSPAAPAAPTPRAAEAPSAGAARGRFADLIASVAKSGRTGAGAQVRPQEAIARIEKALGAQIGAILQHPEVRRLEQAWRGLRLLVDRTQGHSGVRIDVLSARKEDAAQALERAAAAPASVEPPVSFALIDSIVDGSAVSFAELDAIARAAEAATVPTVVNGSAGLLGLADLTGVERLDNKAALFQAPERAPWRSAAARPAMRWVTIALNGALSRGPYDKSTSRVREAAIQELPNDEGGHVWISPAWLVGALVISSFRDTGWPCRIVGARHGGQVENLPVRELRTGYEGDEGVAVPTEAFISTDTQKELARSGILALASAPNSDSVYVQIAPTAYVPPEKRTYDSATTEPEARLDRVSLGDQLFVARLAQFLQALCRNLPASSDPAEVQPVVEGAVWALFENAPPAGPEITVRARSAAGATSALVTVRPRRFLGVALEEITLDMPLG